MENWPLSLIIGVAGQALLVLTTSELLFRATQNRRGRKLGFGLLSLSFTVLWSLALGFMSGVTESPISFY